MPRFRYPLPKGVTEKEYEQALQYTDLKDWVFKRNKGVLIRSMVMVALYRYSKRDGKEWFRSQVLSDEMVPMQPLSQTPLITAYRVNSLMRQVVRKTDRWESKQGKVQMQYRRVK